VSYRGEALDDFSLVRIGASEQQMTTFPSDPDGDVLAALAAQGVDLTQPLQIEFAIDAPDEKAAMAIEKALIDAGYDSQFEYDEGEPEDDGEVDPDDEEFGPSWTVFANVLMIPEYQEIRRVQTELDRIAGPMGGKSDGWGALIDGDDDGYDVDDD
jgi:regulator of ribonuclease activity B